ncbi:MAG: hypothetical protein AB1578_08940 [Thermodesulfobacteriota bacterium]|jgi:hypothetical protein
MLSNTSSGPGERRRWIVPTVFLILAAATANLVARAGQPLTVSSIDIVFLLALAIVTGMYVILARGDGQPGSGSEQEPPGHGGRGSAPPEGIPNENMPAGAAARGA